MFKKINKMLREIAQDNNLSIYWALAMFLVFICAAVLAFVAWTLYLFYWLFSKLKIFAKKSDLHPQI